METIFSFYFEQFQIYRKVENDYSINTHFLIA